MMRAPMTNELHHERSPVTDGGYFARALPFVRPRREATVRRLLALADIVAIATALAVATSPALGGKGPGAAHLSWGLVTLPFWILIIKAYGLYDRDGKRVSHSTVDDIPWIFHALVIGSLGLWGFYRLMPTEPLILRQGITFFCVAFAGVFLARAAARRFARAVISAERVVFVGGGRMALALVHKIRTHPERSEEHTSELQSPA